MGLRLRIQLLNSLGRQTCRPCQSLDDILFELAKVRAVSTGGRWMLTEVPKKARVSLEKMKIPVPIGVST